MKLTVKDLSAEEKLKLICGKDWWHTNDLDGKIPSICMTDASMGVRMPDDFTQWSGDRPSVAYPSMQTLANTWNMDIVNKYARSVADDCLEAGADLLLGPGVNIKRSPLCGRNFEYFSEDPYLAGIMAREYVSAMQAEGVGACVKHFCANNLEMNRKEQTSDIDERTLREIYYKPFEIASQAKPFSIMCSYNRINGVYGSEYKKGYDALRKEYGFDGTVISDWDAVRNRAKSAKAGCDLEMPFSQSNYDKLLRDYKNGVLSDEELDVCAQRVLDLIYRCKDNGKGKKSTTTLEERIQFTRTVCEEGIVLLKNDGALPIKHGQSVAMCGWYGRPCAYERKRPEFLVGGGSGMVSRITPAPDMLKILDDFHDGKVLYEPAFSENGVDSAFMIPRNAVNNAALCDVNLVFAGTGASLEGEGGDRMMMKLYGAAPERTIMDTAAVNSNTIVVLFAGAPIDMSSWIDSVSAVVYVGYPGEKGAEALADILLGKINPSGKITETFPVSYQQTPAAQCYADSSVTRYQEGLDVGYRYYDTYGVPVLFPFGHGVSYTKFDYSRLALEPCDDGIKVKYTISNCGTMDGKEISQVYVRPICPLVYRPDKELKGFSKDAVKAGQSVTVEVRLGLDAFAYWSSALDRWTVADGIYEIVVAASSRDERVSKKVIISDGDIKVL